MPRQTFISRESFVEATELQAKQSLLSVPVFATSIQFVAENKMLQQYRFVYCLPKYKMEYSVDVSVLPLNDQYTRISLRGKHFNEQAFDDDEKMLIALKDFESAIVAAIKGDSSLYHAYEPKRKASKKTQLTSVLTASAILFFLKKFS